MPGINILGSCSLDLVSYVSHFPFAGETLASTSFLQNLGGKGSNQAVAASLLCPDIKTRFIGAVGQDAYADLVIAGMKGKGVGVEDVKRVEGDTGLAIIWVEEQSGENRIVIVPGANGKISHQYYLKNERLNPLSSVSIEERSNIFLLTQLEIPLDVVISANIHASTNGITTLFNPAPAPSKSTAHKFTDEFFESISYLILNEIEAIQLSSSSNLTDPDSMTLDQATELAISLLERGVQRSVLLTLGVRGVIYVSRSQTQTSKDSTISRHVPAKRYRMIGENEWRKVVDTTAAGDCFIGAFVSGLAMRWDETVAVEWACKASAIAVGRKGAGGSIPTFEEVQNGEFEDLTC